MSHPAIRCSSLYWAEVLLLGLVRPLTLTILYHTLQIPSQLPVSAKTTAAAKIAAAVPSVPATKSHAAAWPSPESPAQASPALPPLPLTAAAPAAIPTAAKSISSLP